MQQLLIGRRPAHSQVKQQQHRIGAGQGFEAAGDAKPLHRVAGGADAGGIQQGEGYALQHQLRFEQVAGGAGQLGHDRPLAAAEPVEQAALAHVGAAHNRHPQPLAQQLALLRLGQHRRQLAAHGLQFGPHGVGIEGRQIVFEIDPGLELRQLVEQALPQGADPALQPAIQPRHGQLGGATTAGRHHLHQGLGPGEIEAAVEEGPLAELPRPRQPRPGRQHQLQHPPHHHQPAVAVEFHHVLAGEAAGGAHQQQQSLIHPFAAGRIHHMAVQHPMALPGLATRRPKQAPADRLSRRPRQPHDRHTALAGGHGGGDRGDGARGIAAIASIAPRVRTRIGCSTSHRIHAAS